MQNTVAFVIIGILVLIIIGLSTNYFQSTETTTTTVPPTTTIFTPTTTTTTQILAKYSLSGYVTLFEGNCMPTVCDNPPCETTCKTSFVSRKVYIRELTFIDDMSGGYLVSPKTNLIASVTSNANGYYNIQLDEGTYSIFVEDNGKEYCNSFRGSGEACEVELSRNTQYNISITIHASF